MWLLQNATISRAGIRHYATLKVPTLKFWVKRFLGLQFIENWFESWSDQDRISPYSINTIWLSQGMRIGKTLSVRRGNITWSNTKFSQQNLYEIYGRQTDVLTWIFVKILRVKGLTKTASQPALEMRLMRKWPWISMDKTMNRRKTDQELPVKYSYIGFMIEISSWNIWWSISTCCWNWKEKDFFNNREKCKTNKYSCT